MVCNAPPPLLPPYPNQNNDNTDLNVKFVPLFAYCFMGRRMSATAWAMAATAVAGTLLLCNDGSPPNIGDLWSVAGVSLGAVPCLFFVCVCVCACVCVCVRVCVCVCVGLRC